MLGVDGGGLETQLEALSVTLICWRHACLLMISPWQDYCKRLRVFIVSGPSVHLAALVTCTCVRCIPCTRVLQHELCVVHVHIVIKVIKLLHVLLELRGTAMFCMTVHCKTGVPT